MFQFILHNFFMFQKKRKKRFTGSCSGQNQNNLYRHAGLVIARPVPPSCAEHAQTVKAKRCNLRKCGKYQQ